MKRKYCRNIGFISEILAMELWNFLSNTMQYWQNVRTQIVRAIFYACIINICHDMTNIRQNIVHGNNIGPILLWGYSYSQFSQKVISSYILKIHLFTITKYYKIKIKKIERQPRKKIISKTCGHCCKKKVSGSSAGENQIFSF